MVSLGFLNTSNAPTDEAKVAFPTDLHTPSPESDKSVIIHDETTLQANKDQLISSLGSKGYKRDASKEREIMISEEKSGLEVIKKKTLLEISPIICI